MEDGHENLYSDWLYKKLIEDELPWANKADLKLKKFLERYTLHDSHWVGIFHHIAFDQSVTLAFEWNSVWLPDEIKEGRSHVDDSPYLFIQIEEVKEISTCNFGKLDDIKISRAIGDSEILEIDGAFHLSIDDVYGGQVYIVFTGCHSILALNSDFSFLKI